MGTDDQPRGGGVVICPGENQRLDPTSVPDGIDYRLLAEVMEEAAGYFQWRDRRPRLIRVILNFSFRLGQPSALLASLEPLRQQTRLGISRPASLTEAVNDLVRCRVVQRVRHGSEGIELVPLPDWWNWAVPALDEQCADREFVAGQIGWTVREETELGGTAVGIQPVRQWRLFRYQQLAGEPAPALLAPEPGLTEAVAAVARTEAVKTTMAGSSAVAKKAMADSPKRGRASARDELVGVDVDECVGYFRQLYPEWRGGGGRMRDAYMRKFAGNRGPRLVFRALRALKDFGPDRVHAPINWLKGVVDDMDPGRQ